MPAQLATLICLGIVAWLFSRDRAMRPACSHALWFPVIWILILGSRPVSVWLAGSSDVSISDTEGSPVDRFVYLGLIVAGWIVLRRRQVNWSDVVSRNKWLFLYFAYLGISVLWSDFPFLSFKRWIKEIGNIFMVMIVLTETDVTAALKSLFFRCASFIIPLSVLFIKYYPNLGRYFDIWTWQYSYGGVTTDKNMLGMSLFLCGTGVCWGILDLWKQKPRDWKELGAHLSLIALAFYLWAKANSATSMACTGLACAMLIGMKIPTVQRIVERVGFGGVFLAVGFFLSLNLFFNPLEMITEGLGRNMTFTGRTDIWNEVLQTKINPMIGTGYCSFWQGARAEKVSENLGFFFKLREAHNGYLDVYLNSGFLGLGLIVMAILVGLKTAFKRVVLGESIDAARMALLLSAIIYNVTESALSGLVLLWVVLLLAIMEAPPSLQPNTEPETTFDYDETAAGETFAH